MIKILHSSPNSRNVTAALFKEALRVLGGDPAAVNHDYSRILYLAPTFAKIRESQRIFFELLSSPECFIPPETATIGEFSRRIYSAYGKGRVLPGSFIPVVLSRLSGRGIGFSSLLADFISNIKRRFPERDIAEIKTLFTEVFKDSNIPEAVAKLPMDSLGIWDEYRTFMTKNGLMDEDDALNASSGLIGNDGSAGGLYSGGYLLLIDGFLDLCVSEINFLMCMMRNFGHTFISAPSLLNTGMAGDFIAYLRNDLGAIEENLSRDPGMPTLTYYVYPNPESELEGIARSIKSLYISGKFRELEGITVLYPMKKYAQMVERVFKRYGVPYDISFRQPLAERRPFLDLISLLLSVAGGYPRLKFSQFLSSPHFTKIPRSLKDRIPMISLRSGIISGKVPWLQMIADDPESDMSPDCRAELIEGLEWVFAISGKLEDIADSGTIDSFTEILRRLTDELGFLGLQESSSADEGAIKEERKRFREVLDRMTLLGGMDTSPVSLSDFTEILIHILRTIFVEEEGRGVKVLDLAEAAGLSHEYLYAGGLTDDTMPGKPDIDYFLPDSIKKRLGFNHLDRYLELRRFIFTNVVSSSPNLHLSYPSADGDAQYLPSSFLYSAEALRENLPGMFSREEYLVREGRNPLSASLQEISVRNAAFQQYLKVTDIDAYRFCPRKFFVEKVAKVASPEVREYEVEAITLGNILHRIMEKIMLDPLGDFEEFGRKAAAIADEVIGDRKLDSYWKDLVKDTFLSILPDIYEMELGIRREGYVSTVVEKTISGEPVTGIKLKGKIDRFDKFSDSVQIIDYKSGGAAMNCAQVLRGKENLQLFLYAAIMKHQGYNVDRVGLYSLKDIEVKWCPSQRKCRGRENENIDNYIIESLKHLEEAVGRLRRGDFQARPLDDYNCRNCHEYSLCPYTQQ